VYLYDLVLTNFGSFEALRALPITIDLSFFFGGVASALVQVRRG
jgi:hypothetical protein